MPDQNVYSMVLPRLSNSTIEATVTEWHREPGDELKVGEPLVTVETDKIVSQLEAPVGGRLLEQCVGADEDLEVGDELARISL